MGETIRTFGMPRLSPTVPYPDTSSKTNVESVRNCIIKVSSRHLEYALTANTLNHVDFAVSISP